QLLREEAGRYRSEPLEPPAHVIEAVTRRNWPGNVRELRNDADRYVLGLGIDGLDPAAGEQPGISLAERMARYEKSVIASALQAHGGSLKPVYEELGISRKTLYEKMQRYKLDR